MIYTTHLLDNMWVEFDEFGEYSDDLLLAKASEDGD